ncbi:MAG: hypothetical protein K9I71_04370 [Ignavibacteriales bacterium]|nr:hypothetical protein [Ignavibacteriales bacterium]MCF8315333.1 hypothetical protein [Ignavibacteriales bacterium]MCF8436775.1 hypothetical protein [Ignavibacteriales bacterium]
MKRKINLLLTSAGSRSIEGVLDCLAPVRDSINCIGTNSHPEFVSLKYLDSAFIVPETSSAGQFKERINNILSEVKPDLIINGRDEELPLLAEIVNESELAGTFPATNMASVYGDKYKTYRFCLQNGLPFVQTAFTETEVKQLLSEKGFPLIAKPRWNGHASKDVFVIFEENDLLTLISKTGYVFQPFAAAPELKQKYRDLRYNKGVPLLMNPVNEYYNIDLLLDKNGKELKRCITRAQRAGSIIKQMWLSDDAFMHGIADKCSAVLEKAGHHGPLNIQGYLNGNSFDVFEWNARFVGSVYGFALLGKNLVLDWLKSNVSGIEASRGLHSPPGKVFRPMRYQLVPQELIERLRREGIVCQVESLSS